MAYFIGGTIKPNGYVDLFRRLNKKVIMHWVGTDVLTAKKDLKTDNYCQNYIWGIYHFCEVSWIQEELKEIGITAEIVPFATIEGKIGKDVNLPSKFSILTYIPENRPEFYGMEEVIRLALDFPDIAINVTAMRAYPKALPGNIRLLGWVEDLAKELANCVLYLRMTEHDGLSFLVLEALANGRYVCYSCPLEHTFHVKDYSTLKRIVANFYEEFQQGLIKPNEAGREFIERNFDQKLILGNLIAKFKMISQERGN